jgi:hypothetical protein
MPGFHVAAALVSLLQFLRVHDARLLLLSGLFASAAGARFFGDGSWLGFVFDLVSGCCGLGLLYVLSPRHPHHPQPGPPPHVA